MERKFYHKLAKKLRRRHGIREIHNRIVRSKGYGAAEWICVQIILNNGDSINYQKSPDVTIDELLAFLMHFGSLTRTIDVFGDQISTIRITVDSNPRIRCELLDSTNNGEDFMARFMDWFRRIHHDDYEIEETVVQNRFRPLLEALNAAEMVRSRKALARRLAFDDRKVGKIEEVIGQFGRNSMVNTWVIRGSGDPNQSPKNTYGNEANSNERNGNRNPNRGGANDDRQDPMNQQLLEQESQQPEHHPQSVERSENQESSTENRGTKRKNQRKDSDEASAKREKPDEENSKHLLDPQNQDSENPRSSGENREEERKNEEQDASAKQGKTGEEDSTNPQPADISQKFLPPMTDEELDRFVADMMRIPPGAKIQIPHSEQRSPKEQLRIFAKVMQEITKRLTEAANPPVQDLPPEQHGTDISSLSSHVGSDDGLRVLAAVAEVAPLSAAGPYSDISSEGSPDNANLFSEDLLDDLEIQTALQADIEQQAKPTNPAETQHVNPEPVVQEDSLIEDIDSFQDLLMGRDRDDVLRELNESEDRHIEYVDPNEFYLRPGSDPFSARWRRRSLIRDEFDRLFDRGMRDNFGQRIYRYLMSVSSVIKMHADGNHPITTLEIQFWVRRFRNQNENRTRNQYGNPTMNGFSTIQTHLTLSEVFEEAEAKAREAAERAAIQLVLDNLVDQVCNQVEQPHPPNDEDSKPTNPDPSSSSKTPK